MTNAQKFQYVTFWHWFFYWKKSKPGYKRVISRWLCIDIIISIFVAYFIGVSFEDIAKYTLLPLCSVFIGVAVSATSIGHSIVTSKEIRELAKHNRGGLEDYVYSYYIAILFLLISICYWGLIALEMIPSNVIIIQTSCLFISVKELFLIPGLILISLSIRLSWTTLISVAIFIFASQHIKEHID